MYYSLLAMAVVFCSLLDVARAVSVSVALAVTTELKLARKRLRPTVLRGGLEQKEVHVFC